MFVFMRRGTDQAAGILKSQKPLFSDREKILMAQIGESPQWNVPLLDLEGKTPRVSDGHGATV